VTRALLIAGAGGVGKTTVSAALGVAAARRGVDTLVLTVDPARRLADALGLKHLGNAPSPVPGADHLSAAMLDASASWEAIIRRHADPETVGRLLASRFFRAIADRFPAGQAYAAAEEMARHLEQGKFELLVVDTPPAAGGIDFFTAPGKVRSLVGGRVLRLLTGARLPGRRQLYRVAGRPVLKVADTVLGGPLLEDLAEFLLDLRTAYDGIRKRAKTVERHFGRATTFVVTTADPTPVREATRFLEEVPNARARFKVVFNRALPDEWRHAQGHGPGAENLHRWAAEATRQADVREEFAGRYGVDPVVVPWLPEAPTSLEGLLELVRASPGLDTPPPAGPPAG
jgi:anion-transporting  ArsA/GET3 family ATPase